MFKYLILFKHRFFPHFACATHPTVVKCPKESAMPVHTNLLRSASRPKVENVCLKIYVVQMFFLANLDFFKNYMFQFLILKFWFGICSYLDLVLQLNMFVFWFWLFGRTSKKKTFRGQSFTRVLGQRVWNYSSNSDCVVKL